MMTFDFKFSEDGLYLNGELLRRKWTGSSRNLYVGETYVVKEEDEEDRIRLAQCANENEMWLDIIEECDKVFFVPTLHYRREKKFDYVVQPRLKLREKAKLEKIEAVFSTTILELKDRYNLRDLDYHDNHCLNWGFFYQQPVIFDYGF